MKKSPKYFLLSSCVLSLVFSTIVIQLFAQYTISSPDNKIKVEVNTGKQISYAIYYENKKILLPSAIGMEFRNYPSPGGYGKVKKAEKRDQSGIIVSPVPEKRVRIKDEYNELNILFEQPISIVFRAYNDGVAYRFKSGFKDSVIINEEQAEFNFPRGCSLYYPEVEKRSDADSFHTSFESVYQYRLIDSVSDNALFFNPILITPVSGPKIVITESGIEDYPGMFHRVSASNGIIGCFARYPLKEQIKGSEFPQAVVTERADYIAITKGTREYPWRVLAIAAKDAELPGNDIVYRLAPPSRVKDISWIHPGKGTDEWIIGINLFNVPFKAGLNTATYKYYIDFAKQFGFDRIMMDAGWSDNKDLFKINPDINMDELVAYAKLKGIRLSLWTLALTLNRQLDSALAQFNKWGIDYIMTDFMDRDDQEMVKFYYRIAEACAQHKIMIMFHGAFKPAGFNRTYPNAITREGVLGSEYNIWSNKADPRHDLLLPFIRMVGGPFDYEPGLLDNATREQFRPIPEQVMSMGTRCHQLAMFVVYDNPMQIFSGNPSQGLLEPAFMNLLGSIPSIWDETIIVDGKVGEYIVTARKKGNDWYIGAMTNWNDRVLKLDCSFLGEGEYEYESCEDGVNANRYPSDYKIVKGKMTPAHTIEVSMSKGGGYFIRLRRF